MEIRKTEAKESAFPETQIDPQFNFHSHGLNKLEYFAAIAMQGLLAADTKFEQTEESIVSMAVNHARYLILEINTINEED